MIGLTAAILVVKDSSCQKERNHFNPEVECLDLPAADGEIGVPIPVMSTEGFLTVRPLTIQGHFEDFKLPPDYNKRDLPAEHKGHFTSPLEVSLKVLIAGITHVDEFENVSSVGSCLSQVSCRVVSCRVVSVELNPAPDVSAGFAGPLITKL
ncbi:unnamed protein product [Timema podura]|uniref:Uncharacterized protein n=1 Tax=Timema podura TaxID=61482 RepID=A0ABN7P5K4_TIMPD|nr:unnamed protein product [Timema podura]